jgi:hypothetical protein
MSRPMSGIEGRGRTGAHDAGARGTGNGALAGLAMAAAVVMAAAGTGCGAGGGPSPKPAEAANLYVKSFSAPNYAGIYLDEDLQFVLSAPVLDESINPDSIQMRTGAAGGTAPFGTFVRGVFYVDPQTGTRIVVDPQFVSPPLVNLVENGKRDISRIPINARIDQGFDQPVTSNGGRLVLFDRTQRDVITFIPEIPTRAALDDTGYTSSANYTVVVPGYPATNTLENIAGDQLLSPNNRIFTSSFRVVSNVAPQLFIGSECAGIPRVIHSEPYNGTSEVPVTSTIAVRFSQPLDPRTVTPDKFKVELVSVAAPYPQIPVSVFLAQQRLGKIEVILTPINPMPADATIRVTLDSGIEDLLGQALNQTTISFFTGFGISPFTPDPLEEFDDVLRLDGASTTANWNANRPYVGGIPGALTAAFAPYAGDGTDGAFSATVGLTTTLNTGTVSQRVYNFTTFSIPIGATVVATGSYPLVIQCQDSVDISGTISLDGVAGGNGFRGDSTASTTAPGGLGGAGGPGGNPGGHGAMAVLGTGGNFDGLDGQGLTAGSGGIGGSTGENDGGTTAPSSWLSNSPAGATAPFWPRPVYTGGPSQCGAGNANCTNPPKSFDPVRARECGGGGGGSLLGGDADNKGSTLIQRNGAGFANGGFGGGTWGSDTMAGASLSATVTVKDPANLPNGLRTITLTNIPTLVAGMGGAGGGGGGGEDDSQGDSVHWGVADGSDEGGGAGGGGGGALQIRTFTTINVAGTISCKGGAGGGAYDDVTLTAFSQGAGGGGGSGGAIWLQCRGAMTIQGGAVFDVNGGVGGQGLATGTTDIWTGGTGAPGRIRIEDSDGLMSNAPASSTQGTFTPLLDLASSGVSSWQNTFIFDPDYSDPIVTADVHPELTNNGTIKIYMEGAQENVSTTAVDDPDLSKATGWILVWDSSLPGGTVAGDPTSILDTNYSKWWRFKVDFTVSAFHTFTDPMPEVQSIQFKISQ